MIRLFIMGIKYQVLSKPKAHQLAEKMKENGSQKSASTWPGEVPRKDTRKGSRTWLPGSPKKQKNATYGRQAPKTTKVQEVLQNNGKKILPGAFLKIMLLIPKTLRIPLQNCSFLLHHTVMEVSYY